MPFHTHLGVRYLAFEDFLPPGTTHAIFTRQGGESPAPWQSLNTGGTVGDDPARVRRNRHLAFRALGREPDSMYDVWQVHSADVVLCNAPHPHFNNPPELKADSIITANPKVTLFMRFAECTPLLFYDPQKQAVGIAHAGWQGTLKDVAGATVRAMQAAYGSNPADLYAVIGPAIGPDHYEVGEEVAARVHCVFGKDSQALLRREYGAKPHLDLWMANETLLRRAGVTHIHTSALCTACHPQDWYSHRAQHGKTGRFGALIALA